MAARVLVRFALNGPFYHRLVVASALLLLSACGSPAVEVDSSREETEVIETTPSFTPAPDILTPTHTPRPILTPTPETEPSLSPLALSLEVSSADLDNLEASQVGAMASIQNFTVEDEKSLLPEGFSLVVSEGQTGQASFAYVDQANNPFFVPAVFPLKATKVVEGETLEATGHMEISTGLVTYNFSDGQQGFFLNAVPAQELEGMEEPVVVLAQDPQGHFQLIGIDLNAASSKVLTLDLSLAQEAQVEDGVLSYRNANETKEQTVILYQGELSAPEKQALVSVLMLTDIGAWPKEMPETYAQGVELGEDEVFTEFMLELRKLMLLNLGVADFESVDSKALLSNPQEAKNIGEQMLNAIEAQILSGNILKEDEEAQRLPLLFMTPSELRQRMPTEYTDESFVKIMNGEGGKVIGPYDLNYNVFAVNLAQPVYTVMSHDLYNAWERKPGLVQRRIRK